MTLRRRTSPTLGPKLQELKRIQREYSQAYRALLSARHELTNLINEYEPDDSTKRRILALEAQIRFYKESLDNLGRQKLRVIIKA